MARFIGSNRNSGNYGEDVFLEALLNSYPDEFIVYRNRQIDGKEFDIAMLMPNIGIVIFEVKGWRTSSILRVENGDSVIINTPDGEFPASPLKQVRGYRFAMEKRIREKTGSFPLVFGMVVYPQISCNDYHSLHLDVVSEQQFTVLKDDLADSISLASKIAKAVQDVSTWYRTEFDPELQYKVRCMFEGDSVPAPDRMPSALHRNVPGHRSIPYSIFYHIPSIDDYSSEVELEVKKLYASGCKIYAVVYDTDTFLKIGAAIEWVLQQKNLYRHNQKLGIKYKSTEKNRPNINENLTLFSAFNVSICLNQRSNSLPYFQLINGSEGQYQDAMKQLGKECLFNYNQYAVEHTPIDKNVLVRAGAGTGKTYTMISRIGFLAYMCPGDAIDLIKQIIMITFTNEAADQMRNKLKEHFKNQYLLTSDKTFLTLIEKIDYMQISTIHSYAKQMISQIGVEFGYGIDVKVTSSEFVRAKYVNRLLNDYISRKKQTNSNFEQLLRMPVYMVSNDIIEFIQKLRNKSIDVSSLTSSNFGTVDSQTGFELHELFSEIIPKVESEYQGQLLDDNTIHLSTIMSVLYRIVTDPSCAARIKNSQNATQQFIFVDEFQDTDNTQIDILVILAQLLNSRLFVVGDIKQCIYRFRGANEAAFDRLPINEESWREYSLQNNYRTDRTLLDIFDHSFASWGSNGNSLLSYEPTRDKLNGTVSFNGYITPYNRFYKQIHIASESGRFDALFKEIKRIQTWINYEEAKRGIILPPEKRSIAILVRENWQAEEVRKAGLQYQGGKIEIQTNTGGDLYQTASALDMLALVNALLHFDEPEYLFDLLTSNFFGVNVPHSELYTIRKKAKMMSWRNDAENKNEMREYLIDSINTMLSKMATGNNTWESIVVALRTKPVLQLLHEIYSVLKPEKNYSKDINKQKNYLANVDLIIERIISGSRAENLTINSFAQNLNISVISGVNVNSRTMDNDGIPPIQCITVHKSKGLEYGHVIVPYASFRIDQLKKSANLNVSITQNNNSPEIGYSVILHDENQTIHNNFFNELNEKSERCCEETRILYVAMTRAIRSFSWIVQDDRSTNGLSWQNIIHP